MRARSYVNVLVHTVVSVIIRCCFHYSAKGMDSMVIEWRRSIVMLKSLLLTFIVQSMFSFLTMGTTTSQEYVQQPDS